MVHLRVRMEVLGDMIWAADGLTVYSTGKGSVGHSVIILMVQRIQVLSKVIVD